MVRLRAALISAVLLLGQMFLAPAHALDPLPTPTGEIILTVDGKIALRNTADGKAAFDHDPVLQTERFQDESVWSLETMTLN